MKKNKTLTIYVLVIIILVGCGKINSTSSIYAAAGEGYTDIVSIDNLLFSIPLYISNAATAVTQITDEMDYYSNNAYSYKDGSSTYILFCMDELVVIASKGTTFGFSQTISKEECLNNSPLINTWFKKDRKKFSYIEGQNSNYYKIIADVSAEVAITTELYGDFIGKLAVIETPDEEWGLFAGVASESFDSLSQQQSAFINSIAKSMTLYNKPENKEPDYDVVIDQNLKENIFSPTVSPVTDSVITDDTVSVEVPEQPIDTGKDEIIFNTEENTQALSQPTLMPKTNQEVEPSSNANKSISENHAGVNLNNQKKQNKEIGKAYQSDEYYMLSLGQCGILQCYGISDNNQPVIRINKIYTGNEAIVKIKEFCKKQQIYDYFDAPEGYSWHLAEYDVSYQNCTERGYINIRLTGLDGEKLVFRGVPVDQRTHDANYNIEEQDNCVYNNYCYYAVPNGCHEYALVCGDGNTSSDSQLLAAYYHIKL